MRAFGAPPPAVRAVLVVAATSLFMVLVAWATLIGPDEVFTGPGRAPRTMTTDDADVHAEAHHRRRRRPPTPEAEPDDLASLPECEAPDTTIQDAEDLVREADPPLWVEILVWAFEFLLLAAVLAPRRARGRPGTPTSCSAAPATAASVRPSSSPTLAEPARLAAAITEDAAEQDHLLREGEPRNAIVAAWHRFEVQGERAPAWPAGVGDLVGVRASGSSTSWPPTPVR